MTVICVLYILIGIKLRQSKLLYGKKVKSSDSQRYIKGQSRVVRMLSKLLSENFQINELLWKLILVSSWTLSMMIDRSNENHFLSFYPHQPTPHFFLNSCCRRGFLPVLGTFPRATNHGFLWKYNEKVVQQRRLIYEDLRRADIYLWHLLLLVDMHQSGAVQYNEP